jgi:DNA-binding response OmpR family regulator
MKPCVLIVDDSLTVRMDLKEAFEAAGFETLTSATLEAARDVGRQRSFDLAILDVLLPDGDGLSLLQEFKAAPATASRPVLLLSTEDEVRDRIRGLKTGADDYVGKPYDAGQVVARARDLLHRRDSRPRERPLVVLIDDSPTFAAALREEMEKAGYEVRTGGSAEEGLRLIADLRPDAVVVDQELPGMDGPEMLRRLRADAPLRRTPCLLLTASERKADELRALEAGADSFSLKHAGPGVILAKVAALLRASPETKGAPAPTSLLAPKRILAVDDSQTFLDELCEQLHGEGYDVVPAHSGEEAIELLGMQPVDGILLDLLMPGLSGQETCRRIKAEAAWREIPLIVLTAVDESTAMIESINAGADDYIAKSSDFEILKARLRAQLRRKQFEDENRDIRDQLHRREMEAVEMEALRELSATRAALIADLEKKNDELRRAKAEVESANQELESFSYSVSHDLRAPLRAIDGFSSIVMEKAAELNPQSRRHLERVREAAQRMGQLIDDMLNLSRVGRQALRREPVDLSAEAEKIVARLRATPPADRAVEVAIAGGLAAQGDRGLLGIALENLLGNAWKFSSKTAQARIEVGQQAAPDGSRVFFVRDNGAGFDMAYADKLFGTFQRLHTNEEFPGTGVGLATVARVIRRHGGRIWAESAPGRGATFFFTLEA